MGSIFDRLNTEIESIGRRAVAAIDEGRLRLELLRLRRGQDGAARELGLLIHRRERGATVDAVQVDALLTRLDHLEAELAKTEREIAAQKGETVSVSAAPPPATTPKADAEIVEG